MKKTISESTLKNIIKESVKKMLEESFPYGRPNDEIMPATEAQYRYIEMLTGEDMRDKKLNVRQAGEIIDAYKKRAKAGKPITKKLLMQIAKFDKEIAKSCSELGVTAREGESIFFKLLSLSRAQGQPYTRKQLEELEDDTYRSIDKILAKHMPEENPEEEPMVEPAFAEMNESRLKKIVAESVRRVLNEIGDTERGQNLIGLAAKRKKDKYWGKDGSYKDMEDMWSLEHAARDERNKKLDTLEYQTLANAYDKGAKYGITLDEKYPGEEIFAKVVDWLNSGKYKEIESGGDWGTSSKGYPYDDEFTGGYRLELPEGYSLEFEMSGIYMDRDGGEHGEGEVECSIFGPDGEEVAYIDNNNMEIPGAWEIIEFCENKIM